MAINVIGASEGAGGSALPLGAAEKLTTFDTKGFYGEITGPFDAGEYIVKANQYNTAGPVHLIDDNDNVYTVVGEDRIKLSQSTTKLRTFPGYEFADSNFELQGAGGYQYYSVENGLRNYAPNINHRLRILPSGEYLCLMQKRQDNTDYYYALSSRDFVNWRHWRYAGDRDWFYYDESPGGDRAYLYESSDDPRVMYTAASDLPAHPEETTHTVYPTNTNQNDYVYWMIMPDDNTVVYATNQSSRYLVYTTNVSGQSNGTWNTTSLPSGGSAKFYLGKVTDPADNVEKYWVVQNNTLYNSTNGYTYGAGVSTNGYRPSAIYYASWLNLYLLTVESNDGIYLTSTDMDAFTTRSFGHSSRYQNRFAFVINEDAQEIIAFNRDATLRSTDGVNWTLIPEPDTQTAEFYAGGDEYFTMPLQNPATDYAEFVRSARQASNIGYVPSRIAAGHTVEIYSTN